MELKRRKELLLLFSLALLAFSIGHFLSSLALLKIKPCARLPLSTSSLDSLSLRKLPYSLEREGFFRSSAAKVSKPSEEKEREITTSIGSFLLKGTVVCSECTKGMVILKDESGKTVVLTEGESFGGYELVKVYPDSALLKDESGREILLKIEGEKGDVSSNVSKSSSERKPAGKEEKKTFKVKRSEVIGKISSGEFLKEINLVPTENPKGFRVQYVNPKSFIYKLGIRPGDVIVSINDVEIETPEDSFAAFEKLKSEDAITITVFRKGKRVKLHYELE